VEISSSESNENLVLTILCDEFGFHAVKKSIEYKHDYQVVKMRNPSLISKIFNELSYRWQEGKAKEYFEALGEPLQYFLICHLAEDFINDKSFAGIQILESQSI
jgi:hypothetical protein